MDVFTLREYVKAAIEVGRKIKTLNTTEVDSGIAEAYKRALSDWSQHAPSSRDELRLNRALNGYLKNATSYEALDKDTKDFIDCFKKRLSEQDAAQKYLMTLRADEQAKSEELNLQEHRKTQKSILDLKGRMEELNMAPQYVRALLKELPLEQGLERTESTLEEMLTNGRIHSKGAKCLIAEFVRFLFERTGKITEEVKRLRKAGDSYLAETLEEIKKVLTGESEQSLTAIYEKLKEQERQNEVKALEQLIEAAQIQFSSGEARRFYERLLELSPTTKNHFSYAHLLQSLNDFAKARSHYEEALQALRELSKKKPKVYDPDIATILNNLGNLLSDTHQLDQAQDYYEKALLIFEELAKLNPEVYNPDVAMTLSNLGTLHCSLSRFKHAKDLYGKALQIYRKLGEKNHEVYEPYIAILLNNMGNLFCKTNEHEQAKDFYEKVKQIYKELAKKSPEKYKLDIAITLNNLGNLHYHLGEFEQAEDYYKKAIQIYSDLTKLNPEAHEPDVAMTLNNLGSLHHNFGKFEQANGYYKKALQIYRELAKKSPEAYKPDVARTLNNLGSLHDTFSKFKQAEDYYQNAIQIYRELAKLNPEAYQPEVAITLYLLANLYMLRKDIGNAEKAYQDVHDIYNKLTKTHPGVYEVDYAQILAIGSAFLGKPEQDLEEAKAILSKYPEHPETQGLLSFIEGLSKREQ